MLRPNYLHLITAGLTRHACKKTTHSHSLRSKCHPINHQHRSMHQNTHWFHSNAKDNKMKIKKALIVTKLTRYEFEKVRHGGDVGLADKIRKRGTDFDALMHYHNLHKKMEYRITKAFQEMGVEVKIVNRLSINQEILKWTDILVPVGGDGTFLLAASRATPLFIESSVPIVGFNSDPDRSEGRLLLPKHYSYHIDDAVKKILTGDYEWMHRSRIRLTLLGLNGHAPVPVDLHEYNHVSPVEHKEVFTSENTLLDQINGNGNKNAKDPTKQLTKRILPYLALNEVFIGETLSARVSHLHLRPSTSKIITKTKSSGLCVSTGTGSTSWHTSINRLSEKNVEDLLNLLKENTNNELNGVNPKKISEEYNKNLVFEQEDPRLCYSIREQICVGVWPNPKNFESRGFAKNLYVKSRCVDASLVIDGTISYPFNDGTKALLEVLPEDALLTVKMD